MWSSSQLEKSHKIILSVYNQIAPKMVTARQNPPLRRVSPLATSMFIFSVGAGATPTHRAAAELMKLCVLPLSTRNTILQHPNSPFNRIVRGPRVPVMACREIAACPPSWNSGSSLPPSSTEVLPSSSSSSSQNNLAHLWPGMNVSSQLKHNSLSLLSRNSSVVSFRI
jgi:hypothetical protein